MPFMDEFHSRYQVRETDFAIPGQKMTIYLPQSIEPFINPDDLLDRFPLWPKIWEASAILALKMAALPPDPNKKILEIGAGLGVAGLCAARMGHKITITEYNPDALNFIWANAEVNRIREPDIRKLDWNKPDIQERFDLIIGSEVVFKKEDIPGLLMLFQHFLKPGGTIILAEGMRKTSFLFIKEMEKHYKIIMKRQNVQSDSGKIPVILYEMTAKQ